MAKDFIHVYVKRTGAAAIRRSPETIKLLEEHAHKIAASTGKPEQYEIKPRVGKTRARVRIAAVKIEARRDEHENNTLLKALKQAGGKTTKR